MADRNRRMVLAERPTGMVDESTVRLEEADCRSRDGRGAGQGALHLDRPDDPYLDERCPGLPAADRDRRGRAQPAASSRSEQQQRAATSRATCCSA